MISKRVKSTPKLKKVTKVFLVLPFLFTSLASAGDLSGNVSVEGNLFPSDGAYTNQQETGGVSLSIQPEYKHKWDNDKKSITISPFFRWDQQDKERTHADIRQMDVTAAKGDWEVQAGIGKVFWGVAESQHLVDVINQSDAVDSMDGEEKLGQPLLRVSRLTENGSVDAYILPYFRERTFPGEKGRFRAPLPIDSKSATYESSDKEKHVDYAVRWSETFDEIDLGVHYFKGTSRDPKFVMGIKNGAPVLTPHYEQMSQVGVDLQHTGEEITWKLEAIKRDTKSDDYIAAVGGLEYAMPPIGETDTEVSLLAEYHHDSRGEVREAPFQNDVFVGARVALNDVKGSELLAGTIVDLDNQTKSFRIEGSRRLGNGYKINIEGQVFTDVDKNDPVKTFEKDDYVKIELQKYFLNIKMPKLKLSQAQPSEKELMEAFPEYKKGKFKQIYP